MVARIQMNRKIIGKLIVPCVIIGKIIVKIIVYNGVISQPVPKAR